MKAAIYRNITLLFLGKAFYFLAKGKFTSARVEFALAEAAARNAFDHKMMEAE